MGIAAIGKVFETMSFGEDAGGNTGKYWVLFVFGVCFFFFGGCCLKSSDYVMRHPFGCLFLFYFSLLGIAEAGRCILDLAGKIIRIVVSNYFQFKFVCGT